MVRVARFVGFEEGVEDDGIGFTLHFGDEGDLLQAFVGCPGSAVPIDYSVGLDESRVGWLGINKILTKGAGESHVVTHF